MISVMARLLSRGMRKQSRTKEVGRRSSPKPFQETGLIHGMMEVLEKKSRRGTVFCQSEVAYITRTRWVEFFKVGRTTGCQHAVSFWTQWADSRYELLEKIWATVVGEKMREEVMMDDRIGVSAMMLRWVISNFEIQRGVVQGCTSSSTLPKVFFMA